MTAFQNAVDQLACRHLLAVLDCCFAGAFRWASTRHLELATQTIYRERFEWFVQATAWQAIASSAHDQKALDVVSGEPLGERGDSGRHSPFAKALLQGLAGEADLARSDGTPDGLITSTELFLFLEDQLERLGKGRHRQSPVFWPMARHEKGQFVFANPTAIPTLPDAPQLDDAANPWRGLRSYSQEDAELFYGRSAVSAKLASIVANTEPGSKNELTVVTGPSGSGKSSLVQAGLLPLLASTRRIGLVRPASPSRCPFENLSHALQDAIADGRSVPSSAAMLASPDTFADWLAAPSQGGEPFLIVIDQAEELITQIGDPDAATRFLLMLETALGRNNPRLQIVLTVRSDFEPQIANLALRDRWAAARFLVPPLTQDELRRVIEGPAAVKAIRFDPPSLVDALVNEVIQMPGALPLLSFALSELYTHFLRRGRENRTISEADYQALQGGVTGLLIATEK